jgi:hypothetical protein
LLPVLVSKSESGRAVVFKLTATREITPYLWVYPDEERRAAVYASALVHRLPQSSDQSRGHIRDSPLEAGCWRDHLRSASAHVCTRAVSERSAPRYPSLRGGHCLKQPIGPNAFCRVAFSRVAAMFWIYWDTFWSLFFSAVWFLTIVSHPDAEVAETYR